MTKKLLEKRTQSINIAGDAKFSSFIDREYSLTSGAIGPNLRGRLGIPSFTRIIFYKI
jgi:hypothetical protein